MKKVSLKSAKKMNRYRPELQNKMITKQISQNCFICDEEITEKGVLLLNSRTPYTKTELPTKIGQLMGDRFMVVVSAHDMLCKRCAALLNHLDKLESDLDIVRRALTGYLKMKYGLLDEEEEEFKNYADNIQRDEDEIKDNDMECLLSEQESPESELELDSSSGRKSDIQSLQMPLEECADQNKDPDVIKTFKCAKCNFKTADFSVFQPHYLLCNEVLFKCPMCEKRFESHKYVRNHFMEAHLSNWTCHFCNKKFSEEEDFTSHMKTHLGQTTNPKVSADELHTESGSENESCDDSSQNILGNYECNICDYHCNSKKTFDDHVRKHVVLKLFQCKVCKKRFESDEKLNQHTEEHSSELNEEANVEEKYNVPKEDFAPRDTSTQDVRETNDQNSNALMQNENIELNVENITIKSAMQNSVKNEIMFHTCHKCSLTFVNESLFKEHVKLHKEEETTKVLFCQDASSLLQMEKVNLDVDSAEHEVNSLDSEAQQQYVEMDESLEDMFEKLHADTEKSVTETGCSEKSVMEDMFEKIKDGLEKSRADMECNMNTEGSTNASSLNCNIQSAEFVSEELEVHKVTHIHSSNQEESPFDHCRIVNDKNFFNLEDIKKKGSTSNQDPVITLQSAITITDGQIPVESLLSEDSRQQVENLTDATPIQSDENVKDTFLDIFNMVKEKKLSANDVSEIDHALLENLSNVEVKLEHDDSSSASLSTLNLGPSVEPDVTNQASLGVSKKTYVCAICGFRTPILNELKRHFKEHKDKSFPCKICKTVFPSSQKLSSHLKSHEKLKGKIPCPYCYVEFADKFTLQKHLQVKHQKDKVMYKCVFCDAPFSTKKAYKAHEEVHPERFTHKCDECSQQFMKEKQLLDHKDSVHRDPHCRFCGKEITKIKTLRNHELRHIREKDSFECDVCKRVFKTKTGLRHHVAVHTGEYKFCCDYCGRGFMSRMMMEEHRSMHTKEERYICDVCGRKFSFQSTYWIHRKWHDNPYPYKCSFCGRMFRHSSLLAVHKRKHTGERPYKCPHCPLTFPVGGTLKRHLILHTGVYPFNCESCKRGFTTRHKYAAHLAKIHGDFELLNTKQPQNEYKMVVREDPVHQQSVWHVADDSIPEQLNFKLEAITGEDETSKGLEEGITCAIVPDDMLVDNVVPTRVVKIVLDEASQAVATVTLAEHQTIQSILPDIWYQ